MLSGAVMDNPRRANGTRRNRDRARLMAEGRPCWICRAFGRSGVIDYDLPPGNPLAFEMDELVPISRGGAPTYDNADAAHRCCNEWRGARSVDEVRRLGAEAQRRGGMGKAGPAGKGLPLPPGLAAPPR